MSLKKIYPMLMVLIIFGSVFIPRIPHLLGDTFLIISILLLLMSYLFTTSRQGTPYTRATPFDLPVLLLILFVILSLVRSLNFYDSLRETFKLSAYVILFFLVIYDRNREKTAKVIIWTILATGLFVSLYGVYEQITVVKTFWFPRAAVFSTFPNPNHFGSYAVAGMTLALGLLLFDSLKKKERIFLIIIAIVSSMGLYASNSKGGLLSLLFSLFILALLKGRKSLKIYAGILILLAAGLVFFISSPGHPIRPSGIMNDPYTYERISLWKETARYISDHPWLGTGIGTFGDYYPQYKSMTEMRSAEFAHNEFLNIWAEIGVFGLLVCLWLVVLLFKQGFALMKKTDRLPESLDIQPSQPPVISKGMASGLLAASGGILAQSMVEFNLRTPGIAVAFVSIAAII
ncbi:MAG: O-antigen ligase family protein, partial [bacterium]